MPCKAPINRPANATRNRGVFPHSAAAPTFPRWLAAVCLLLCFLSGPYRLAAQNTLRLGHGIDQRLMENNVLVGWFHGGSSVPVLGGRDIIPVRGGFWLKRFRNGDTNNLEMIAEGPECILDTHNQNVSSDGSILIHGFSSYEAGVLNTNLVISGKGFSTQQSNTVLIIWSDVLTEVTGKSKPGFTTPQPGEIESTNSAEPVVISSEFFQFYQRLKLAKYRGHVRAIQPPYALDCPAMDVQFGANNSLSNAVADDGVTITDERDQGRATGSRAVYEAQAGQIHLTGEPHWQDLLGRQVWAREFVFDRNSGVVSANQEARALLPGKSIGLSDLGLPGAAKTGKEKPDSVFDIHADTMQLDVAGGPTNRPSSAPGDLHNFEAHHHFIMTNEVEHGWATGDAAVFTKETGVLRLTGDAKWSMGEDQVEGDVIEANRNDRTLSARVHSVVRVPARLLRPEPHPAGSKGPSSDPARGVLEIRSDDFFWQTNVATFRGQVHATETEKGGVAARMNCDFMQLTFDDENQIRKMLASGRVEGEELATPANPSTTHAKAERLEVLWYPGGSLLKRIDAAGDFQAEQAVLNHPDKEIYRRARAGMLWMNFSSLTNQVESGLAQTNVFWSQTERARGVMGILRQSERGAQGDRADYQIEPAGRGLVLTGHALGWIGMTNMLTKKFSAQVLTNADSLVWSPSTGKLRGSGPNWEFVPLKDGKFPR